MSLKNRKKFHILLAYLSLAFSGIHFFSSGPTLQVLFVLFMFTIINPKYVFKEAFIIIAISILLIVIGQSIVFGEFSAYQTISVLIKSLLIPLVIFKFSGRNYTSYYVKALFYLCLISLPFYVGSLLSNDFFFFLNDIPKKYPILDPHSTIKVQFILHSATPSRDQLTGLLRNAGPFHEAGIHGLFLLIGYYFNYLNTRKVLDFVGGVFLASAILTFSTATYLGFIVLIFGISLSFKANPILRIILVVFIMIFSIQFFLKNDLMYSKIEKEYNRANERSMHEVTGGRFYGARKSLNVIKKYPLFGRGLTPITRVSEDFDDEFLKYGIMSQFAKLGIVFSILYLILLYRGVLSISRFNKKKGIPDSSLIMFFYIALLINLFSQNFGLSPAIMIIVIIGLEYSFRKRRPILHIQNNHG